MERFIQKTLRAYLIVMGLATAGVLLLALLPATLAPRVFRFALAASHTGLLRHWAFVVGLVGLFLLAAAWRREWVVPAMALAGAEKLLIVVLHLTAAEPLLQPLGLAVDGFGAAYSLVYFAAYARGRGTGTG